jgi:hypothetical protein
MLSLVAYILWALGVRINDRRTGRRLNRRTIVEQDD